MFAVRTNLQLAISEVLSSSPCPTSPPIPSTKAIPELPLSKLICAYVKIAGFSETLHALPSFERALEKFPDCDSSLPGAEEGAYWATLVNRIRKEYWREVLYKDTFGTKKTSYPCPCCGKQVRAEQMKKDLGLEEDESGVAPSTGTLIKCKVDVPEVVETANKRPRKVKRRTVHTRKGSKKPAFDPYGASTSKVSM